MALNLIGHVLDHERAKVASDLCPIRVQDLDEEIRGFVGWNNRDQSGRAENSE